MEEKRTIKVFKTFEEQEAYHLEQMRKTTVRERFISLFKMQQFTQAFRKSASDKRTITIHHGYLNNEFLLFLSCAEQNNLKYMLIGGYAVNYYGYNRIQMTWMSGLNPRAKTGRALLIRYSV